MMQALTTHTKKRGLRGGRKVSLNKKLGEQSTSLLQQ